MDLTLERTGIDKRFYDLCQKVVKENGYAFYDMEYLPSCHELRLFIMDEETKTATIDDCVKVDHAMTPYIDAEEWMPDSLTLQVSSPGVYRSLKTIEHFENVIGQNVLFVLFKKIEADDLPKKIKGQKKITAKLLSVEQEGVLVDIAGSQLSLNFADIKKANVDD